MYLDSLRKHSRLVLYKITIDWIKLWRREGFEPSRRYRQLIFETNALNHSAISPLLKVFILYTK